MKVNTVEYAEDDVVDGYGMSILKGQYYFSGSYLLKDQTMKSGDLYKIDTNNTYLYKECVVYPFVTAIEKGERLLITNTELCNVLAYIEKNGMCPL